MLLAVSISLPLFQEDHDPIYPLTRLDPIIQLVINILLFLHTYITVCGILSNTEDGWCICMVIVIGKQWLRKKI